MKPVLAPRRSLALCPSAPAPFLRGSLGKLSSLQAVACATRPSPPPSFSAAMNDKPHMCKHRCGICQAALSQKVPTAACATGAATGARAATDTATASIIAKTTIAIY